MFTLNGTLALMFPWPRHRILWLAQEVAASQKDPVPWVCGVAVNYTAVSLWKDLELEKFFFYIFFWDSDWDCIHFFNFNRQYVLVSYLLHNDM